MRNLTGLFAFLFLILSQAKAQDKVGINTDSPAARLHVFDAGQVLSENGLLLLGDTSEANLKMDFNYIQSLYGPKRKTKWE